jgi:ABC-2 type transport system permease protein
VSTVLRPASALAGAGFRRWATYRQAALAGAFTNIVFGVIKVSVLFAVADSRHGDVAGYDRTGLSTYAWVSQALIAVVLVFGWTEISDRVRTGDIAVDLARPVDLQLAWLATDLGRACYALGLRAVLPLVVGALTFGVRLPHDPAAALLLPLSVALAVVVSFGCRFALNLMAFWVIDIRGLSTFYVLLSNLLSGLVIPVQFFPGWLHAVAVATPFPSIIQTPTDLFTGQATGTGAVVAVAVQAAWALVMLGVGRLVLARAVRRLVVQGG